MTPKAQVTVSDLKDALSYVSFEKKEENIEEIRNSSDLIYIIPDEIDQKELEKNKTRKSHWCFTIHKYYDPKKETYDNAKNRIKMFFNNLIVKNKIQYYSIGFETGKRGETKHLQGYLFTGHGYSKTFSIAKKMLLDISETPYLSYMYKKSTWLKCVAYTKKEHDFISGGKEPQDHSNKFAEIKLNSLIEEVYHGTKIQQLIERDPMTRCLTIKCQKTLERAYHAYQEKQPYYPPFVCWFLGNTGTGKTTMANLLEEYLNHPVFEVTCDNGFFEGYNSDPYIYFDDFRFNHNDISFQKLLSLTCEKKNMRVNIKGSSVPWRPRIIIFTSPNGINDAKPIISDNNLTYHKKIEENFKQLKRRVHLSLKFNFETEDKYYPDYERILNRIRNQGIPEFLSYYKYHCIKHNIPICDSMKDLEPIKYDIDKYKDNIPRETDGVYRYLHDND
jgi:hypothetical protein